MGRPTKWRDQFIADASREGMQIEAVLAFLRVGATLRRLAEAQCNGDYPCDNGERPVRECPLCGCLWAPSAIAGGPLAKEAHRKARLAGSVAALTISAHSKPQVACQDCRATERARQLVPDGWQAELQGDPRGCIITLVAPSGRRIDVP